MFKNKLLHWAQQFREVAWLDSNSSNQEYSRFESVLAIDAHTALKCSEIGAFEKLDAYRKKIPDWIFGFLSYDLKNDLEPLISENYDGLKFPNLYFFQPKKLFFFKENQIEFLYLNSCASQMERDYRQVCNWEPTKEENEYNKEKGVLENQKISPRISKPEYLKKVEKMQEHIHRGNIYEANFCQEFYAHNFKMDPLKTFLQLNEISNPPFASFFKMNGRFLLSASPERYLQKKGNTLLSQPIKGTAKRAANKKEDAALAKQLEYDPKERSENIMIVDLVRNDLSKIAKKGSVSVAELCEIYTFNQVHQMISTIKAETKKDTPAVALLKATFPMGSMTGVPKISAMKIIEELEETKRGLYSGAVGYFTPQDDFDFNVVIRSILYNSKKNYVSFSVGGAITALSNPENEYEECMVKAGAMLRVLNNSSPMETKSKTSF